MRFLPTPLVGAWRVEPERHEDHRGYFARTWCAREFAARGLDATLVQASVSFNRRRGTLRGMHFQAAPHDEIKLVRCVRGAIHDVIIDLRKDSSSHGQHYGLDLTAENGRALYIPAGMAHGFQTLVDETEVFYQMSAYYVPGAGRGVRWDDPAFGIAWPIADPILHERDATYPDYAPRANR